MDEAAQYNIARWQALNDANALFTRPYREMTLEQAQERLAMYGLPQDIRGKKILALAGGGGQQSVVFSLLGAEVTIVDLSEAQLQRDRAMAAHHNIRPTLIQGDIRNLSMLPTGHFDIVQQAYSLNFVPDIATVFEQITRVLVTGGLYDTLFANPFAAGVRHRDWDGSGYPIRQPYIDGEKITSRDEDWVYDQSQFDVPPVVEYRHTLGKIVEKLTSNGFIITRLIEVGAYEHNANADPATWEHFSAFLPPWLSLQARYQQL
ncbi:MAG: class I SAM-dependent methyltransferase [Aggregatilineales bacterium]